MKPTYSSYDLVDALGITYRILDYWCRTGALEPHRPAAGSGTQRRFDEDDLRIGRVLARLTRLGARGPVLAAIHDTLRTIPHHDWPPCLYITGDGELADGLDVLDDGGWVVPTHTRRCPCPTLEATA